MASAMALEQKRYSQMMSANKFGPNDTYIAVMGVTGSGKSTFISKCCADAGTGVGHTLQSETQEVKLFSFEFNNRKIHLIDTPGFDDTHRLDSDVLKDLAYWLSISYKEKGIKLAGIVYLHPITHVRMNGTAFKNLRTFRKLVGRDSMSSVVLATTMWSDVSVATGNSRESELKSTAEFWGDMRNAGSEVYRHTDDYHSAMNIISHILNKNSTTVLGLQKELVDENKALDDTEAGREVERDMIRQRELYEQRLLETREEMKEAIAQKDKKLIEQIAKEQEAFQAKIDAAEQGRKDMQIKMEELIKEKEVQHAEAMANLDKKIKDQEDYMQKKDREFEEHKERMRLQREQDDKKKAAQEAELDAAKEEVERGNLEKVVFLQGCMYALEQQNAEAEERERKLREEAKRKEAELIQNQARMQEMYNQQAQAAMYQQSMYRQSMAQQQQYEQTMYQAAGGAMAGAGIGLGGLAMMAGCSVM